ncbi:glutamate receptor 3.2, partial [Tanacetum coccineum]
LLDDVNSDPRVLPGRRLTISINDSNYTGLYGIFGALKYLEIPSVAVIGPQRSELVKVLSQLANGLHVPILSFTALDPSLSPFQYPYQTAPNDLYQMKALAAIGLEVGSIQRIQGIGYGVLEFLRVGTTLDIFQNIVFLYIQYGVLVFFRYNALSLIPLWSLVNAGTYTPYLPLWIRRIGSENSNLQNIFI